jgi:hypothetical protein
MKILKIILVLILSGCMQKKENIYNYNYNNQKILIDSENVYSGNEQEIDTDVINQEDINNDVLIIKDYKDIHYIPSNDITNGTILEMLESGGKIWTVRKLEEYLSFWGWREDIVDILDKPRGDVIYKVRRDKSRQTNVQTIAITKETDTVSGIEYEGKLLEDHWVKILIDSDKSGWIFGRKLDVERGGPKYLTPENVEPYILEGSKEFEKYYVKENVM